jgi:hypothetical protein
MSNNDRDRAEARFKKAANANQGAKDGKTARDAAAGAVLENMARLKAMRLAKEAAEPTPAVTVIKPRGKPTKKPAAKPLGSWLSSQQSGGRRT